MDLELLLKNEMADLGGRRGSWGKKKRGDESQNSLEGAQKWETNSTRKQKEIRKDFGAGEKGRIPGEIRSGDKRGNVWKEGDLSLVRGNKSIKEGW